MFYACSGEYTRTQDTTSSAEGKRVHQRTYKSPAALIQRGLSTKRIRRLRTLKGVKVLWFRLHFLFQ